MNFESIKIENFRNFLDLELKLMNKNILFGLNDIGKTNFLCAIRFLLDRNYRRLGLADCDFFQKNISKTIRITLKIDIRDSNDDDTKKIYKYMRGAISSTTEFVYIQLIADYNKEKLCAEPKLYWGNDIENLEDIPSYQANYELDNIFNIVYIDSSIQLESAFRKYTREIFRDEKSLSEEEREKIKKTIEGLNGNIAKLANIKSLENEIKSQYQNYRNEKNLSIAIRSEIELDNIHSKLTPYICYESDKTYPTSGDGRRKILAYTLLSLENKKLEEKKINVFLIEELENHLHRSMQISLSHQLFTDKLYKHMFMTTHSSLLLGQMDNVNLIKLFKDGKTDGKSYSYRVPDEYKKLKQKLNQNLADAIYADFVLLVEGPSEKILFETIMQNKCSNYESFGGYILEVDGINFAEYYNVLKPLGIKVIVKTDNDLKLNEKKKEYNLLGLNRCLSLIGEDKICNTNNVDCKNFETNKKDIQRDIFDNRYKIECNLLRNNKIFISRIDLENDLYEIIPTKMDDLAKNTKKNAVDYLQSAKMINMIELCKTLKTRNINSIFELSKKKDSFVNSGITTIILPFNLPFKF
ncbi:ATP-dependent nuclease [Acetonema longum]|uniref:SMC domain-containing protein n=1 Tax=Acetonema longum DSM 6540 TaxID=1009370 RepID=F7NKG7_9FIRM|nr:TOPRIM nucleotidyl transferase/hydrolase domain-containing protein [Acetonema longum]EGO63463.1 SMC domain-containing protein [Acetonema longum DSM 6540]